MEGLLSKVRQHLVSMPRVQILSDLHLEVGDQYSAFTFPVSAPFLLLGGDIGRLIDYDAYRGFLQAQVVRYRRVFLVLGNHEFYGLDYPSGLEAAQRLSKEPTLTNGLSSLTILGCTLWSAIPADSSSVVEAKVNDFKKIELWSVQKHNQLHTEEVDWLRDRVVQVMTDAASGKSRLLIATHHAPCIEGTSRPEHTSNPWTSAFATDLIDGNGWEGVKVWVFGHTHYSSRFVRDGIRVVSNQRGYVLPGATRAMGGSKSKHRQEFDASMVITV
ncbi:Metallo-dependent phosphatase-like protein [Chaetomium strumarium]|uniref:Metallo-dependent phosphatase-like protein n=1 Tax=Chaetomium strumarium TaxID=1170767 RepID=A0AAJ0LZS7_9PEZI|nr:Metallo-dependent phosphatase-like protein [Chaetomium strumarium]